MSRPRKNIVDYFPHIAKSGKTVFILEQEFGNDGYAALFKILELLATNEGHFYNCEDIIQWKFLKAKLLINDDTRVLAIIQLLADINILDKELWENNRVLWSDRFIENISDVYKKRATEIPLKPSLRQRKPQTADVSGSDNPQSKVEYSKVEYNTCVFFNEFWGNYPERNGKKQNKQKTLDLFNKLENDEKTLIVKCALNYKNSEFVKRGIGIKDPNRFISNKDNKEYWKEWLEPESKDNRLAATRVERSACCKAPIYNFKDLQFCGSCNTECEIYKGED